MRYSNESKLEFVLSIILNAICLIGVLLLVYCALVIGYSVIEQLTEATQSIFDIMP